MKLSQLLSSVSDVQNPPSSDKDITGIAFDSRQVQKGNLFVAVRGTHTDAAQFINDALAKGAAAIVAEKTSALPDAIIVGNARLALSQLAAAFYGHQPSHMVAVTGTDGKTSAADFFRQLCTLAGHKAASIGTLGVLGSAKAYPALNTTPDPVLLHRTLSELVEEGIDYAAMEASSHGLDQYRLHGVKVQAAAFTNLTRDHLDYHETEDAYFAAKLKLFTEVLAKDGTAILNADDARFAALADACRARDCRVLSYGKAGKDYRIDALTLLSHGIDVAATLHGKPYRFTLPMIGSFQVMNLLAALGLAEACSIPFEKLLAMIAQLKPVPGRLELAATLPNQAPVFVDYAHTPAALQNILTTVRPHVKGKLWVVFGCGGDRDKGKRPQMGGIAAIQADEVIVTDDNPRSENPQVIRNEVLSPLSPMELAHVKDIGDRKEAIAYAVAHLQEGDGLVIAGKGHEKTQIYVDRTLAFDDVQAAQEAVKAL